MLGPPQANIPCHLLLSYVWEPFFSLSPFMHRKPAPKCYVHCTCVSPCFAGSWPSPATFPFICLGTLPPSIALRTQARFKPGCAFSPGFRGAQNKPPAAARPGGRADGPGAAAVPGLPEAPGGHRGQGPARGLDGGGAGGALPGGHGPVGQGRSNWEKGGPLPPNSHLLKKVFNFPPLVLKGIYHYWNMFIFPRGLHQIESQRMHHGHVTWFTARAEISAVRYARVDERGVHKAVCIGRFQSQCIT